MLVVVYRLLVQSVFPIFKDKAVREECLNLENGTDKLSGKAGEQLPIYNAWQPLATFLHINWRTRVTALGPETHPSYLHLNANQQQLENQTVYVVSNAIVVSSW